MDGKDNVSSFQFIGLYNTSNDLIVFNNENYQPMILINVRGMKDNYNLKLDRNEGFKPVIYKNDHYVEYTGLDIEFLNAELTLVDGTGCLISIDEAKVIINNYYDKFIEYYGTKVLRKECYDLERERFVNINMDDAIIVTYKILGKYEDISDLISYEGNKYIPQIDINIELNGDDEQCDVLLDSKEGFKVITPLTYKIKDTRICSSDGNSCFISIEDAKRFIISNYQLFEPYKHIAAHKMYHPDLSQEERFLNFSNS